MQRRTKRQVKRIIRYALIIVVTAFFIFPLIWLGLTSIKPRAVLFDKPSWSSLFFVPTAKNYIDVFYREQYGLPPVRTYFEMLLVNSLLISLASVGLSTIIGTLAAWAFSRFEMRGKNTMMFFILSTRMLPPIATLVPLYLLYRALGFMYTHHGLILLYTMFTLAFSVWMMKGFIDEIPKELEEAAMVDGHSRLGAFFKATLPQALTAMAATAMFCLMTAWNEYAFALVVTGTDWTHARTAPVQLAKTFGESGYNWGLITASELIYLIPVIIITFIMQEYLLRGITFGTIKR